MLPPIMEARTAFIAPAAPRKVKITAQLQIKNRLTDGGKKLRNRKITKPAATKHKKAAIKSNARNQLRSNAVCAAAASNPRYQPNAQAMCKNPKIKAHNAAKYSIKFIS